MNSSLEKSPATDQPIDAASLLERCLGDPTFVQRILEKFRSTSDSMLNAITQAVVSGNAEQIGRSAHSLKGAAANLSAEPIRSIAQRLEELSHTSELALAEQSLSDLKQELARCIAYIPSVNAQLQKQPTPAGKP